MTVLLQLFPAVRLSRTQTSSTNWPTALPFHFSGIVNLVEEEKTLSPGGENRTPKNQPLPHFHPGEIWFGMMSNYAEASSE